MIVATQEAGPTSADAPPSRPFTVSLADDYLEWRLSLPARAMLAPFAFTKIVIVQSLEPHERPTGANLHTFLRGLNGLLGLSVPFEYMECESAREFRSIMERLIDDCRGGHIPLLHVECHGDDRDGLIFENGSELAWRDTAELLTRLNEACRYNLFAVFAACFGAYFLGQISAYRSAPCYAIVAPTAITYPDELETGFKLFYKNLLQTWDAGIAVRRLQSHHLVYGRWFGETAETWFERVVEDYMKSRCTRKAMKPRIKRLYRRLLSDGNRQSIGRLKRMIRQRNKQVFLDDYFDRFFGVNRFPENKGRFSAVHERVRRRLGDLWCKPTYRP